MKAAVYGRYGSPDVVTVDDIPKPVPRNDEVQVRIHAATVGVVDSLARQGAPACARVQPGGLLPGRWVFAAGRVVCAGEGAQLQVPIVNYPVRGTSEIRGIDRAPGPPITS
jgi:NADPH:quinone reductase-like Zn-dependent oxidoreductase